MPFQTVSAGTCSPGIPCTGYDIYSQPNANTDASYNGNKTGAWTAPSGDSIQTACDGNFMNQIYARAFLESQREVMLSEQIIHKPDSVLEYTCFDQYAGLAAQNIDNLFSARQDWHNRAIPLWTEDDATNEDLDGDGDPNTVTINNDGTTYLSDQTDYSVFEDDRYDNILEEILMDTMSEYINNNFSHTYMGESITLDNNMNLSSLPTGSYDCDHMLAIWDIAKCIDFGEDDRFRSFNTLVNSDIRSIPQACPNRDITTSDGGILPSPTTQIASDVVDSSDTNTKLDNTSSGVDIGASLGVSIPGIPVPIPSIPLTSGGLITRMPSDAPQSPLAPVEDCPAAGGPVSGVNTDMSNDLIRIANNCDDGTDTNAYSATDMMESYEHMVKGYGIFIPGTGSPTAPLRAAVFCTDPIPTGVPVLTYTHTFVVGPNQLPTPERVTYIHYDHICPNSGCYYQPVKYIYNPALPVPTANTIATGQCLPSF